MDRLSPLDAAVAGHLLVHVAHGAVHGAIPVPTTGWRLAYVVVVVFLAPVAALTVAHRDRFAVGAAIATAAGGGAFAFEVVHHFLLANPDHVDHVSSGAFAATAVLSTAGSLLLLAVGAWLLLGGGDETRS